MPFFQQTLRSKIKQPKLFIMLLSLQVFCLFITSAQAAPIPYLTMGQAQLKKTSLHWNKIQTDNPAAESLADQITTVTLRDLTFLNLLTISKNTPQPKADFLIHSHLTYHLTDSQVILEARLEQASQILFKKSYSQSPLEVNTLAHRFANDLVQTLTGSPGIFLTKITMSCNATGKKEIYLMNYDGSSPKQVTHHRSIAFSPAWSPDNTRIAYSLFTRHRNQIKNIDLYEFDLIHQTVQLLSAQKGINSGADYSPDGQTIALTLSHLGYPALFLFNRMTRHSSRLIPSAGFDVDPSWSPDGKTLAFTSSRAGTPMIFTVHADGSQLQRLTYAGRYNATPVWSPSGREILFAGWIDGQFDLFIMDPQGLQIQRLTQNQGNNEDPDFSPDGQWITFSSNRSGQKNIYVMTKNGNFVRRLTYGLGQCTSPRWSHLL